MNGAVRFLTKGAKVHARMRGKSLVTRCGFPEGYCMIPNKAAYIDETTLEKVLKLVTPGIRKMAVRNFYFVWYILFSTYLTLHLCSSKFSADDP